MSPPQALGRGGEGAQPDEWRSLPAPAPFSTGRAPPVIASAAVAPPSRALRRPAPGLPPSGSGAEDWRSLPAPAPAPFSTRRDGARLNAPGGGGGVPGMMRCRGRKVSPGPGVNEGKGGVGHPLSGAPRLAHSASESVREGEGEGNSGFPVYKRDRSRWR